MTKRFKRMVWKLYSTLPADTGTVVLKAYYAIRYGGPREVFKSKYLRNAWEDEETVSGPGSTLKYTESIRSTLPELLRRHSIGTFLDAPCGDYNWFRYVAREPAFRT